MSIEEKVRILETVWASLCQTPGEVQSPEWHRSILEERSTRMATGEITIGSWEEAKARLLQLGQ
jgi:hypothetical protein